VKKSKIKNSGILARGISGYQEIRLPVASRRYLIVKEHGAKKQPLYNKVRTCAPRAKNLHHEAHEEHEEKP